MYKCFLPPNNSTWGVIVRPQAGNVYREVYAAEDQNAWFRFLANELNNNISLIDTFTNLLTTEYIRKDYLNAEVKISSDELDANGNKVYNQNEHWFLTKDILITSYNDGTNDLFEVWCVKNVEVDAPGVYKYILELDLFMTLSYKLKTMLGSGKRLLLTSGHWPNNQFGLNSPNYLPTTTELQKIYNQSIGKIQPGWEKLQLFEKSTQVLIPKSDPRYTEAINYLNKTYFMHILVTALQDMVPSYKGTWFNESVYFSDMFCLLGALVPDDNHRVIGITNDGTNIAFKNAYDAVQNGTLTASGLVENTTYPIYGFCRDINGLTVYLDGENVNTFDIYIDFAGQTTRPVYASEANLYLVCQGVGLNGRFHRKGGIWTDPLNTAVLKTPKSLYVDDPNPDNPANYYNHPRLFCSDILDYKIFLPDGTSYNIYPEYLLSDTQEIEITENITPEGHLLRMAPNDTIDDPNYTRIYGNNPWTGYYASTNSPMCFPTFTDPWQQYIAGHRETATQGFATEQKLAKMNMGLNIAKGAFSGISDLMKGNIGGAITGAVNTAQDAINDHYNNIVKPQLERKDIAETPGKIDKGNGDLVSSLGLFKNRALIYKGELPQNDLAIVATQIFEFGLNNINRNILSENLFDQKYWFEYKKVLGVFENIEEPLPVPAKQVIDDSLANGIRIWHIRNSGEDIKYLKINDFSKNNPDYSKAAAFLASNKK